MRNNSMTIRRFVNGGKITKTILSVIFSSDNDADEASFIAITTSHSIRLFTLPKRYSGGVQYFELEGMDLSVQVNMDKDSAKICNVLFGKLVTETEHTLIKEY